MVRSSIGIQPDADSGLVAQLQAAGFDNGEEIGRGGFGVVYRCTQTELGRTVAVKVLTTDVDEHRSRFVREQRAMARLTGHPNIVVVLHVGETEKGRPFLVMPFCERGCLQDRIGELGHLSAEEVLWLGVKLAGALESAHRLDVLHRDIKPANILITDYGEPALTDFGIAHMADGFRTAEGLFTGSPAYTAPEVVGGDPPSAAADVYSLGATLFTALTGHAAFERRRGEQVVAQFLRIASEPVPDLRAVGVPSELAALVEASMARDPRHRPSVVEFGVELQRLQSEKDLVVDHMAVYGAGPAAPLPASSSSRQVVAGNLPSTVASFVGRRAELAQLSKLATTSRLVTLAGIGGVGKTALAVQAGRQVAESFPDGVWLVELADLRNESLLIEVLAAALGVRNQSARTMSDVVIEFLGDRDLLIILDNCEHIASAAARLADMLLRSCPRLHILATSREVLGVGGESVLALYPLNFPDDTAGSGLSDLSGYDAVTLFLERARAAVPDFSLDGSHAAHVTRICARLDGLPLAIELAAARLRIMSVEQIANALSDRYAVLTHNRRDAPTRQQTLAWCVGWSYDLCSESERQLWSRLSVFAGSFDLDAARHVCGQDGSAEDLLNDVCALVEKSILMRVERDGAVRFKLLETLRDYGRGRLSDEQYIDLQRRHAGWYSTLLAEARVEWFGHRQAEWIRRVVEELANIREALQFSLMDSPASGIQLAVNMRRVWMYGGMLGEGRRWLNSALTATVDQTASRIEALFADAQMAAAQSDFSAADARIAEARRHLSAVAAPAATGLIEFIDGMTGMLSGDFERGFVHCQSALAVTDDLEVQVESRVTLGWLSALSGDVTQAEMRFEEAFAMAKSREESALRTHVLSSLGACRWLMGQFDDAERLLNDSLEHSIRIQDPWTAAQSIEILAWTAGSKHDYWRAALLLAAATAISRASGMALPTWASVGNFHNQCEHDAREALGDAGFEAAYREASSWTFEEAATEILEKAKAKTMSNTVIEEILDVPDVGETSGYPMTDASLNTSPDLLRRDR